MKTWIMKINLMQVLYQYPECHINDYIFNAATHCWQKCHYEQLKDEEQHSILVLLKLKM
jgi:hypothetical protein